MCMTYVGSRRTSLSHQVKIVLKNRYLRLYFPFFFSSIRIGNFIVCVHHFAKSFQAIETSFQFLIRHDYISFILSPCQMRNEWNGMEVEIQNQFTIVYNFYAIKLIIINHFPMSKAILLSQLHTGGKILQIQLIATSLDLFVCLFVQFLLPLQV